MDGDKAGDFKDHGWEASLRGFSFRICNNARRDARSSSQSSAKSRRWWSKASKVAVLCMAVAAVPGDS
jgi:hypothetical protein